VDENNNEEKKVGVGTTKNKKWIKVAKRVCLFFEDNRWTWI